MLSISDLIIFMPKTGLKIDTRLTTDSAGRKRTQVGGVALIYDRKTGSIPIWNQMQLSIPRSLITYSKGAFSDSLQLLSTSRFSIH